MSGSSVRIGCVGLLQDDRPCSPGRRTPRPSRGRCSRCRPRRRARAAASACSSRWARVVEGLHAVHERQVDAGQRRPDRLPPVAISSWSKPSWYVGRASSPRTSTSPGVEVDADRLVADADVVRWPARCSSAVRATRSLDAAVDLATHQVGDAAGGVARPRAPLEGDDLDVGPRPRDAGHRRHPAGVAADHDDTLGHGTEAR